jgi:HlyD family secretion protein
LAASEARRFADLGRKGFVSQSVVDGKLQQQQSADAQGAAAESTLTSARQDLARIKCGGWQVTATAIGLQPPNPR